MDNLHPSPPPSLPPACLPPPFLPNTLTAIVQQMSRTLLTKIYKPPSTLISHPPGNERTLVPVLVGETAERLTGDVESIAAAAAVAPLARCVDVDSSELSRRDQRFYFFLSLLYGAARARSRARSSQPNRTIGVKRDPDASPSSHFLSVWAFHDKSRDALKESTLDKSSSCATCSRRKSNTPPRTC